MARRFKASCPSCGSIELAAGELRLVVNQQPSRSFYLFRCPECETSVRKPAGPRIVELLTAGGVLTVRVHAS